MPKGGRALQRYGRNAMICYQGYKTDRLAQVVKAKEAYRVTNESTEGFWVL